MDRGKICIGSEGNRPCQPCRNAYVKDRSDACASAYAAELRAGIDDGPEAGRADGIAARRFDHQRDE